MNSTNRGLNRFVILLAGLILLGLGGAAVLLGALPAFQEGWKQQAPGVITTITGWLQQTPLGSTGHSWLWVAAAVVCLILVIVIATFVLGQGRGHTRVLIRESKTENGSSVVDASVAEQLIQEALSHRDEIVSSSVSTYDVKGRSVLKITLLCRRGVSPTEASKVVEELLGSMDELVGETIPALVQVSGGFRVRTAGSTRLQ